MPVITIIYHCVALLAGIALLCCALVVFTHGTTADSARLRRIGLSIMVLAAVFLFLHAGHAAVALTSSL